MNHVVKSFSEIAGRPVVPGFTVYSVTDSMFSAHGPVEKSPVGYNNKTRLPTIAILERITAGVYRVWSDNTAILAGGKTQAEYLLTDRAKLKVWEVTGSLLDPISGRQVTVTRTVELASVPAQDASIAKPWTVENITVTKAVPTCRTVLAGMTGMKTAITAAPLGDMEMVTP